MNTKARLIQLAAFGLAAMALMSCGDPEEKANRSTVVAEPNKAAVVPQPAEADVGATRAMSTVVHAALEKLPDGQRTWARAIAKGSTKSHLEEFDGKLKDILGTTNLEEYELGCVEGCDKFSAPDPLTRTIYVFPREHPDVLSRFVEAWDATQRSIGDPGFKLEFDAAISPPTCTGVGNPAPCSSMPFCASDGCGRKPIDGTSCNEC